MKYDYPLYDVLYHEDFKQCLESAAERFADKTLFVFYDGKGEPASYTYAAFAEDVRAMSASILSLGLSGKHIALIGENSYRWLVSLFAITTAGSVAVTVDTEQSDASIQAMVMRADTEAVFCAESFLPLFQGLRKDDGALRHIITLGETVDETVCGFASLLEGGRIRTWMNDRVVIDPDQTAMIIFTSGTTSSAKPVMLSHRNMVANACNAAAMICLWERVFVSLPLYHTYGLTCGILKHLSQGTAICVNGNLKTTLRDLALYQPDSIIAVPLLVEALSERIRVEAKKRGLSELLEKAIAALKGPPRKWQDKNPAAPLREMAAAVLGSNLKIIISGGAHLGHELFDILGAVGVQLMEGYGITECSPLISTNRNQSWRPHTVGLVCPDIEVKLVEGEIWVRGVSVSEKGYYRDEALTADSFQDGWFLTGDLGSFDKDGFLSIIGRKKTLIVFKNGKKVMPEEIEGYVADIPLIGEAIAYGVSNGVGSDDVKLALMVYPHPEQTAGMQSYEILQALQERIDALNRQLPGYKQIQIVKLRSSPFERTALKKIKRHIEGA